MPVLPKNIDNIKIICPEIERSAVMPVDKPTVLKAENSSNRRSKKENFLLANRALSVIVNKNVKQKMQARKRKKVEKAL